METPTLPPYPEVIRTISECRSLRAKAIEYICYAWDNLDPDQCEFDKAERVLSAAKFWEYYIVKTTIQPGASGVGPWQDRASHEATLASMAAQ